MSAPRFRRVTRIECRLSPLPGIPPTNGHGGPPSALPVRSPQCVVHFDDAQGIERQSAPLPIDGINSAGGKKVIDLLDIRADHEGFPVLDIYLVPAAISPRRPTCEITPTGNGLHCFLGSGPSPAA
jgi:hypothetical protein